MKKVYRIYAVSLVMGEELVSTGSTPFRAAREAVRKMGRGFLSGGKSTRDNRRMESREDNTTYFDWF